MKTRLLDLGGMSVAVHVTESAGPPIVLCHGNSSSSTSFRHQFEGELARKFRLVAIDFPGHGASSRAAAPESTYTLPGYARVVRDVAKALAVEDAVFVGWSMGGHVVLEGAQDLPNAAGFFIFGAPPVAGLADFARAATADPALGAAFREKSSDEEIRQLLALFFAPGAKVPESFFEELVATDPAARAAMGASLVRGELRDEVRIVAELLKPLAIAHGTREQIVKRDYYGQLVYANLWRGSVQGLEGVGHSPQWEDPASFDALLGAFAEDCAARR